MANSQVWQSFAAALEIIMWCLLIAMLLSLLLVMLMRCFVRPLVIGFIVLSVVFMFVISYFLWAEYTKLDRDIKDTEEDQRLESDERNRDFFKWSAIFFLVLSIALTILFIALRNEIRFAIALYKEASKPIADMPTMLLAPLLMCVWVALFLLYWIYILLEMASTDEAELMRTDTRTGLGHVIYVEREDYWNFWWYHVFGLLWIYAFIKVSET